MILKINKNIKKKQIQIIMVTQDYELKRRMLKINHEL